MKPTAPPFNRLWPYTVLGLIVLASLLGNLYWLQHNVVQLGHDASAHLTRTLKMAERPAGECSHNGADPYLHFCAGAPRI
jgi:hypothetical protein